MAAKVLVIDDEDAIDQMYKVKFEFEGYEVHIAHNGRAGLEEAEKFLPNIILLDLMMPDMNGTEMLRIMREQPWGKTINVIILTNVSNPAIMEILQPLNIKDYLIKSQVSPSDVVDVVKRITPVAPQQAA